MERSKQHLLYLMDEFRSLAERLAIRAEHDEYCDVMCEPNENSACTCGLADLLSRLDALARSADRP